MPSESISTHVLCLEMTIADWLSSYLEGSFPRFACQMVITEKGPKYTGVVLLGTIQKIGKVHTLIYKMLPYL